VVNAAQVVPFKSLIVEMSFYELGGNVLNYNHKEIRKKVAELLGRK